MDPEDWATESLEVTRDPDVQYRDLVGNECRYLVDQATFREGGRKRTLNLSSSYEDEHGRLVELRLKQAGVRLAAVLTEILGD